MNRPHVLLAALLALSIPGCGDDGDPDVVDAGHDAGPVEPDPTDAGSPELDAGDDASVEDASTDDAGAEDAGPGDPDAGPSACGTERPDVGSIRGTEGLVIARDGTIYFSQMGGVGRLVPGGSVESSWLRLRGASTVWGLALDAANETLYVGSPGNAMIYAVDLTTASPEARTLVGDVGQPNGLTVGPDGALYFSDFRGSQVLRVDASTASPTATRVTTSTVPSANGVLFDADGTLLVASYARGTVVRLTLVDGVETARETVATGLGSPDGIALDEEGNLYVGDNGGRRLLRVTPDGTTTVLQSGINAAASVEFGAGSLRCTDVYVASNNSLARYEMGTTPGARTLWH